MKTADQWLNDYARTHQNPLNKRIHKVCVPAIFWSVFILLRAIKWPAAMNSVWLNWADLVLLAVLIFYLTLGLRYFMFMLIVGAVCLWSAIEMERMGWNTVWIGASVFVVAWIGQFYGHKVEGRKPAFLQDVLFLLIGPLWVLNAAVGSPASRD